MGGRPVEAYDYHKRGQLLKSDIADQERIFHFSTICIQCELLYLAGYRNAAVLGTENPA